MLYLELCQTFDAKPQTYKATQYIYIYMLYKKNYGGNESIVRPIKYNIVYVLDWTL